MKKIQLKVEFIEEKIKSIEISCKEKDKDFDGEILKILNGLYNKSVPELLKKHIEIGLSSEEKSNEDIAEVPKKESK
ncbi:MAG TPA: DUF6103 family protein [Clostridium sp.]|uniref:DUF6103 family protein n=1 Tax=Clostridium sp. TaxID=1506 RepID=UPI002F920BBA